jgi:large subunit ribosomal protein L4
VESLVGGDKPSTKNAVEALTGLAGDRRQLVVLVRDDALTWLSLRNVASVHLLAVDQLNTYDVLLCDDVVFTKGAYDSFVNGTSSSSTRPATIVEAPAADAAPAATTEPVETVTDEEPKVELPQGAKAPLKSGNAPKGYEIKGNADSGKYHQPGGQWYDATEAEFWFKSAEDAEAAGFVEAGSPESVEQTHAEEDDK